MPSVMQIVTIGLALSATQTTNPPVHRAPLARLPNQAAMKAASDAVVAVDVTECLRQHPELRGEPGGSGHVRVSFLPDGTVKEARVDSWFAGTRLGQCIEGLYAAIRIFPAAPSSMVVDRTFVVSTRWKPPHASGPPFDEKAAETAIRAVSLAACSDLTGPNGPGEAELYYDPSGQVGLVSVNDPFTGTPKSECIAGALRAASVPAFGADVAEVRVTFEFPEGA
jgi:hypothetical protein